MRRILRILAIVLAVGTLVTWLVTGANTGWTKTQREVRTVDEVTQIEAVSYEKRFTAGVDFLGAGLLGVAALFGFSFLFRSTPKTQPR